MHLVLLALSSLILQFPNDRRGVNFSIPLDGGTVDLVNVTFLRPASGSYIEARPDLSFTAKNNTGSAWDSIEIAFVATGECNGAHHEWRPTAKISLPLGVGGTVEKPYKDVILSLLDDVKGCKVATITASLIRATNYTTFIDGATGQKTDLTPQRKLEAEKAAEQKAGEARFSAYLKGEKAKTVSACRTLYARTVDKRVSDLTVRETDEIKSCKSLDLYPPMPWAVK